MANDKNAKGQYFRFYYRDFLHGSRLFTTEEKGAYLLLLCEQWDAGHLPNNPKALSKIAGISEKKLKNILEKFKTDERGDLKNIRLELERYRYDEFINKQVNNGAKGGRKPKNSNQNETHGLPNANPTLKSGLTQIKPTNNHKPITNNHKETNVSVPRAPELLPDRGAHCPLWDEVLEFFLHQSADDESAWRFFNRYEGLGWMQGITPIKNWRAFANIWIADPFQVEQRIQAQKGKAQNRTVVMSYFMGGEVTWTEQEYEQYRNNPGASGYTFVRYED